MKITNKQLRQVIKEELEKTLQEMQVGLGLPHEFSNEDLYRHCMQFLSDNPNIIDGSPEHFKAMDLLKILNNRIKSAGVFHRGTSSEEMEYGREMQGKLSMMRRAVAQAIGVGYRYDGLSRRRKDFYRK
tara:strand:- start:3 stop:389 length:387 start_codon:yes stop_codon:yes gene_type:complete